MVLGISETLIESLKSQRSCSELLIPNNILLFRFIEQVVVLSTAGGVAPLLNQPAQKGVLTTPGALQTPAPLATVRKGASLMPWEVFWRSHVPYAKKSL